MFKTLALLSLVISSVHGHAFVTTVQGANGLSTAGFGVDTTGSIPRTGTTEQPFQIDTPVLKDLKTNPCGATLLAGSINIATELTAAEKLGLGTIPANGSITLGLHQVNADGGGPFTAEINTDGTGTSWTATTVSSQPPGVNGLLHNGPADSFITVDIPASTTCTGGAGKNACLIRLNNGGPGSSSFSNGAGPFGGCVAVAQGTGSAAATSAIVASTTNFGAAGTTKAAVTSTSAAVVAASTAKATGKTTGTTATTAKKGKRVVSRAFFKTMAERRSAGAEIEEQVKASARDVVVVDLLTRALNSVEARQLLSAQLIDELKTSTGTAIDIPIDALAQHDDFAALGGNSTSPTNAVLTAQQAIDLKKAVQLAIESAFNGMNANVDAGSFGSDSSITDAANAQADADQAAGTTSINAGNAGVGAFNTAVVNSLLGGLPGVGTATVSITAATSTGTDTAIATGTDTAITSAVTATAVVSSVAAGSTATTSGKTGKTTGQTGANVAAGKGFGRGRKPRALRFMRRVESN